MTQSLLTRLGMPPFVPLPFLANGKIQTIVAPHFPYRASLCNSVQHIVTLPSNDKIVLVENRSALWRKSQRIVLLVHGLTGSQESTYIVRVTRLLIKQGFLVIRMNLRGCGPGMGMAKHLYHSGRSEDTREIVLWLKKQYPNSPVTQVGFSLGANITLKMAGEDGNHPSGNLDSIVAISPPLDLYTSVQLIINKSNQIFNKYFVSKLLKDVSLLQKFFPELPHPHLPKITNLYEFDDCYTAPQGGFKDAKEYYTRCSSEQFIEPISVPLFMLYAKDDPVISARSFLRIPKRDYFDILITSHGGHASWLGYTDKWYRYRWMDHIIVKWINWFDQQN